MKHVGLALQQVHAADLSLIVTLLSAYLDGIFGWLQATVIKK